MGPFHIPWPIIFLYALGIIGVPLLIEILLHTDWWEKYSDYYYSFNVKDEGEDK